MKHHRFWMVLADIAHFIRLEETRINGLYPVSAELFFRVHYSGRSKPKPKSQGRAWERFKKQCRAQDIIKIESGCGYAFPFLVDLDQLDRDVLRALPMEIGDDENEDQDQDQTQREKDVEPI